MLQTWPWDTIAKWLFLIALAGLVLAFGYLMFGPEVSEPILEAPHD